MTAPIQDVQAAYKQFKRRYGRMLRGVKKAMDTNLQKSLVENVAALAFQAGFNAEKAPKSKPKLQPWRRGIR